MTGRAKLWYIAAVVWLVAFLAAVVKSEIVVAGLSICMVILCLVMGDES